jgi:hypothetical protein
MELEPFSPAAWEGIGRCLDAGGELDLTHRAAF